METEDNQTETALRESEERFRQIVESLPDAILVRHAEIVVYANPAAFRLFRASHADELVGKNYLDLVHPDDQPESIERIRKGLSENWIAPLRQHRVMTLDGQVVQVESWGVPVRYQGQTQIFGILRDITDRKRTEQLLMRSEHEKEMILNSIFENFVYFDPELRIQWANQAAAQSVGRTPAELLGRHCYEIWHQGKEPCRNCPVVKARETGMPQQLETTTPDGRHWIGRGYPVFDEHGKLVGMTELAQDITQRKKAEDALRISEEKYRTAFENTAVGMALIALDGTAIEINTALAHMLGYTKQELFGGTVRDVMHPDDFEDHRLLFKRLLEGELPYGDSERRLLCKNGVVINTQIWSTIQRDEHGKPLYMVTMVRDVSAQVRAQKEKDQLQSQLLQAQKMEAIGALAGGIAHDFNNILSAIIGFTELSTLSEGAPVEYLQEALKAAHRARDLVKQILSFSRQTDEERTPVDVGLIVREVVKFLRASIPATIDLNCRIDDPAGAVFGNSVQLHQILMNLATNAVHAIGENPGSIDIEVQGVTLTDDEKDGCFDLEAGPYVRLSVKDTGRGIPLEMQERIFDPYFTTKEMGVGTGLGLAVVSGIVKKCNGAIRVESAPGKGAVFKVWLPKVGLASGRPETEKVTPRGGSESILFVDDEKMLVDIGEKILRRLGYDVVTRTSPIEALELFKANPKRFDLVISDQTMPGMRGDVLASELMKINPAIPVILCTGYSQQLDQARAAKKGIKALVMKPLLMDDIDRAIRRVLKSEKKH
jgi:PAS domain S-box-containing protein